MYPNRSSFPGRSSFARRTPRDPKCDTLNENGLFAGCSSRDVERVARQCTQVSLRRGQVITREGRYGSSFFLLSEGEVEIERDGTSLGTLGRHSFFGGQSLMSSEPCSATVTATEAAEVLVFSRPEFRSLMQVQPVSSQVVVVESARRRIPDRLVPGVGA